MKKIKNPNKILVIVSLVIVVGILLSWFGVPSSKKFAPLTSENIKIKGVDWNAAGCGLRQELCKVETNTLGVSYKGDNNGFFNCGRLVVDIEVPDEVLNEANYFTTKLGCIYFIDGKRSPSLENSYYSFNPGYSEVRIPENLNLYSDTAIQLCCRGNWESTSSISACQTIILQKFCQ